MELGGIAAIGSLLPSTVELDKTRIQGASQSQIDERVIAGSEQRGDEALDILAIGIGISALAGAAAGVYEKRNGKFYPGPDSPVYTQE